MSKLNCICGNQISFVTSPNEQTGFLLTDQGMDELYSKNEDSKPIFFSDIHERGRHILECFKCGRLAINHPEINSNSVKWYNPEDGKSGNLMKFIEEHKT